MSHGIRNYLNHSEIAIQKEAMDSVALPGATLVLNNLSLATSQHPNETPNNRFEESNRRIHDTLEHRDNKPHQQEPLQQHQQQHQQQQQQQQHQHIVQNLAPNGTAASTPKHSENRGFHCQASDSPLSLPAALPLPPPPLLLPLPQENRAIPQQDTGVIALPLPPEQREPTLTLPLLLPPPQQVDPITILPPPPQQKDSTAMLSSPLQQNPMAILPPLPPQEHNPIAIVPPPEQQELSKQGLAVTRNKEHEEHSRHSKQFATTGNSETSNSYNSDRCSSQRQQPVPDFTPLRRARDQDSPPKNIHEYASPFKKRKMARALLVNKDDDSSSCGGANVKSPEPQPRQQLAQGRPSMHLSGREIKNSEINQQQHRQISNNNNNHHQQQEAIVPQNRMPGLLSIPNNHHIAASSSSSSSSSNSNSTAGRGNNSSPRQLQEHSKQQEKKLLAPLSTGTGYAEQPTFGKRKKMNHVISDEDDMKQPQGRHIGHSNGGALGLYHIPKKGTLSTAVVVSSLHTVSSSVKDEKASGDSMLDADRIAALQLQEAEMRRSARIKTKDKRDPQRFHAGHNSPQASSSSSATLLNPIVSDCAELGTPGSHYSPDEERHSMEQLRKRQDAAYDFGVRKKTIPSQLHHLNGSVMIANGPETNSFDDDRRGPDDNDDDDDDNEDDDEEDADHEEAEEEEDDEEEDVEKAQKRKPKHDQGSKPKKSARKTVSKNNSKVYDSVKGTTCHQCKQKTVDGKTMCSLCTNNSGSTIRGAFCGSCLRNRYGETIEEAVKNPNWICPVCRNICNCSSCRRKSGKIPISITTREALKKGYDSVLEYLRITEKTIYNSQEGHRQHKQHDDE